VAIQFQCIACGSIHSVNDRAAGRRIRCPSCNELVLATPWLPPEESLAAAEKPPSAAEPVAEELPDPDPPPFIAPPQEPKPSPQPPPPSRKPIIFRADRKGQESEMDMTPMVDVTFLLLIFFMVTASFTMQKSLNVPKPESNEPSQQARTIRDFQDNPDYIVVRVDGFNTFHVTAAAFEDEIEAPSEQELLVKLRQAKQGDARGNVPSKMLVLASGEAQYERIVMAIDAGNDIGMEEVQLVNFDDEE
jgi:biopolymer transport protein ExbD